MAGPARIGKPKKTKGAVEKLLAMASKNTGATLIIAGLLAITIFLLFSTPRTEEQAQAENNMLDTCENVNKVGVVANRRLKDWVDSPGRKSAEELWGTLTNWQRKSTVQEVTQALVEQEDLQKTIGRVLMAPDFRRLFTSCAPDLHGEHEEGTAFWTLLGAWSQGGEKHASENVMGEDAYDVFSESIDRGFWNQGSLFTETEMREFSRIGYTSTRNAMLGRFYLQFKEIMANKVAMVEAGVELEFPPEPEPEPEWQDEPSGQDVVHMTDETFDSAVASKAHALVMFYAPWCGHCKQFKPDYGKAATLLKDSDVVIAGLDATKSKQVKKRFEVTGFPTVVYFQNGNEKEKYESGRSLYDILDFLNDSTRMGGVLDDLVAEHKPPPVVEWQDEENDVVHMTDDNFSTEVAAKPHALVMFYAPWCGHCKSFKPHYSEAAAALKDSDAIVGAVDVTKHEKVGKEFDIKGFPTVLYFENGKQVGTFTSERTTQGVVDFLQEKMGGGKTEL